jgi:hypothetical protein
MMYLSDRRKYKPLYNNAGAGQAGCHIPPVENGYHVDISAKGVTLEPPATRTNDRKKRG